jgi:simple sugar transport system substrate-binding protein
MKRLIAAAAFAVAASIAGSALAERPVDSSKVRKDLAAEATGKQYKIATVVKVDGIAWFERMREGVKQ